jgi:hypothetical protein
MKCLRPAIAMILVASVPAAAAPQPTVWSPYERSARPDGTPSRCLEHRRGAQRAGEARLYVFQIFNDCNRRIRAVCDIAYAPNCDYGRDVTIAAHLDAPIEPYGESPAFGRSAAAPPGSAQGCFFARCTEAASAATAPGQGVGAP